MPARKTSTLPTRIWKFSARVEPESRETARQILFDAHRYYNRLIEIERARHAEYCAIRGAHVPELARLQSEYDRVDDSVAAIYRETRDLRANAFRAHGTKSRMLPPEFQARIDAAQSAKKDAIAAMREHRKAFGALLLPGDTEYDRRRIEYAGGNGAAPRVVEAANARTLSEMLSEPAWHDAWKDLARSQAAALAAKKRHRAACGLNAGTYLAVEEAAAEATKDALPRAPYFRRMDRDLDGRASPEGRIRVQCRKGLRWIDVCAGRAYRIGCDTHPKRTGGRGLYADLAIDASTDGKPGRVVHVGAMLHRVPPDDADVKWVTLLVRRDRTELQLTLEHASFAEAKRPAGQRSTEHVRLGWARVDDGIRVAEWPGGSVVCPKATLRTLEHAESVRGIADARLDRAVRRLRLLTYRAGHRMSARGWEQLAGRDRATLRSVCVEYARFVLGDVGDRWRAWVRERRTRGEDLYVEPIVLRATMPAREAVAWWCYLWARKDRHLLEMSANLDAKFRNGRDAHYRSESIRLATEFESLTIDSYSIAKLAELAPVSMTGDCEIATGQRAAAAPGRFREILVEVMAARISKCERPRDAKKPASARTSRKGSKLPKVRPPREDERASDDAAQ